MFNLNAFKILLVVLFNVLSFIFIKGQTIKLTPELLKTEELYNEVYHSIFGENNMMVEEGYLIKNIETTGSNLITNTTSGNTRETKAIICGFVNSDKQSGNLEWNKIPSYISSSDTIIIPEYIINGKGESIYIDRIAENAFATHSGFQTLILPKTLKRIEENAFSQCDNIKKIIIGEEIQYLGPECFNPRELEEVYFLGNNPPAFSSSKPPFGTDFNQVTIYVPLGAKNAFKSNDYFSRFKIIEMDLKPLSYDCNLIREEQKKNYWDYIQLLCDNKILETIEPATEKTITAGTFTAQTNNDIPPTKNTVKDYSANTAQKSKSKTGNFKIKKPSVSVNWESILGGQRLGRFTNIGFISSTLKQEYHPDLKSNFGISLSKGTTYFLHKPIAGFISIGIDVVWFDISYTNYKINDLSDIYDSRETYNLNQIDLSIGAGVSATFNFFRHLQASVYFRFNPTANVLMFDGENQSGYASMFHTGFNLSYYKVGLGIEGRFGKWKTKTNIEEYSNNYNDGFYWGNSPDKLTNSLSGFRAYLCFRF